MYASSYVIFQKRVRVFQWDSKHRETMIRSAFIVSRCLESPFKHETRVFEIASQSIEIDLLIQLFIE